MAWLVLVAVLFIGALIIIYGIRLVLFNTMNFIESCFVSRCSLLPNLFLYIAIIALIQASKFIVILHKRKPRTSVKGAFTLKSVVLGVIILFALILWLPMYIALFFISARIFSAIVPYWVVVIITVLPASCVIIFMTLRAYQSKTLKTLRFVYHATIIATLILTITSLLTTVVVTELYYPVYIGSLKNTYGASCQLEVAWNITNNYFRVQGYYPTYGVPVPKPAQIFELSDLRMHWMYRKAFVLAKTGSCGDIAIALTTLLHDALGCKTRIVIFHGVDHVIPEVMVNETWYVFDISYTTSQFPVPADKYFEYLTTYYPNVASSTEGFTDYETGEDVSLEHELLKERGPA
jgi:hypothetical protein